MSTRRDRARAANPDLTVLGFPSAAELRRRLPRLVVGLLALGIGIAMMVEARLGVSPYDVLHQGLADLTGLSFGTVVIGLGLLVLLLWIPLGQRFGIGTVINTLTVGLIVDAFLDWSPDPSTIGLRWVYLLGGIVIIAFGVGLYIGAGLGPGPRDGLMTGIAAKGYPLWLVRTGLELTALLAGWLLGGDVGIGTLLFAFGIGPLGHFFLLRLHLGVGGGDPDPTATIGE
ncbi:MAG: membrane protein YczE [Acidimicrobiia bacterium]